VGDHKTTSDLQWAKTPEDLLTDPQAVIYAKNEGDTDVDLLWIYYQTKKTRKSLPVLQTLTRDHTSLQFANLELTTHKMRVMVDESRKAEGEVVEYVRTLPYNSEACNAFGGCPYRHLCKLGPADKMASLFGNQLKTLEDQMTQGLSSLIARISNGIPTQAPVDAGPVIPDPGKAPAVTVDHGAKGQDTFTKDFINPPPQPASVHTAPTTPPPPADTAATSTILPPAQEAPQKRTRRTKAEMEAARAATQATANTTPEPLTSPADSPSKWGYTLYVDCLPSTPVQEVSEVIRMAKAAVCEKTGKPDYRLVDFGHGPGLLALAVEDLLDQGALSGDVFVSSQMQETLAVLEVLTRKAASVVRSVR
jgi:hypothetical protein